MPATRSWPSVSVPVLSNATMSMCANRSSASAERTRIPLRAAAPMAMVFTSGTGDAERAGTSHHQHAEPRHPGPFRAAAPPGDDDQTCQRHGGGNEQSGGAVRQPLDVRTMFQRVLDARYDARHHGRVHRLRAAQFDGAVDDQRAGAHAVARRASGGHGLAGKHGFIDGGGPALDHAIDGNALPGEHLDHIAGVHRGRVDRCPRVVAAKASQWRARVPSIRAPRGGRGAGRALRASGPLLPAAAPCRPCRSRSGRNAG